MVIFVALNALQHTIFKEFSNNEKWEQYSLLNMLYKDKTDIKLAVNKLCLKKFGGRFSIEHYRENNSNYAKDYKLIIPPMISIIPFIEEISNNDYVELDIPQIKDKFNKLSDELKLKRSKPLPESLNTLDTCMNLKYV